MGIDKMKTKKTLSIFIKKHKYVFFMVVSLACACFVSCFMHIFQDTLSLKSWLNSTFFYWGFLYPVGFVAYENMRTEPL